MWSWQPVAHENMWALCLIPLIYLSLRNALVQGKKHQYEQDQMFLCIALNKQCLWACGWKLFERWVQCNCQNVVWAINEELIIWIRNASNIPWMRMYKIYVFSIFTAWILSWLSFMHGREPRSVPKFLVDLKKQVKIEPPLKKQRHF
jgi:hypothetical protein